MYSFGCVFLANDPVLRPQEGSAHENGSISDSRSLERPTSALYAYLLTFLGFVVPHVSRVEVQPYSLAMTGVRPRPATLISASASLATLIDWLGFAP